MRWSSFGLAVIAATALVGAPLDAADTHSAVSYVERPIGGPSAESGRTLPPSNGRAAYGIDILSRVDIDIQPDALRTALLAKSGDHDEATQALLDRVTALQDAARVVRQRTDAAETAFLAEDWDLARANIQQMGSDLGRIFRALMTAMTVRLEEEGATDASTRANLAVGATLIESYPGYDIPTLSRMFERELERLYVDVAAIDPGFLVEIQAHLIDRRGRPFAIFLPGYNTVETGPIKPATKLRFEFSDSERALYDQYDALARDIESANSIANAVLAQLEAEFNLVRPSLEALGEDVTNAWDETRESLGELATWRKRETWSTWSQSLADEIQTAVAPEYEALLTAIEDTAEDIKGFEELANLDEFLAGRNAAQAMDALLAVFRDDREAFSAARALQAATWRERGETLRDFIAALERNAGGLLERIRNDPDGPFADLQAAIQAVDTLGSAAIDFAPRAVAWLQKVLDIPVMRIAGSLPVPDGQTRLPVAEDPDTEFELRTVAQQTNRGDRIRVQYRFFKGQDEIPDTGWHDEFWLREFGWSSNVLASLAFTQRDSGPDDSWEPSPAANWIAHYRKWPKTGHGMKGMGAVRSVGFGLSTFTLDYDPENDIEVGIGASLSFIDDRLMLGYGTNLQADENSQFWFFSLRLLRLADLP